METTLLDRSDAFDITLDVLLPEMVEEEPRDRAMSALRTVLRPALEKIATGADAAEALGLPMAIPVRMQLRVVAEGTADGAAETADLPVRATISGGPELLQSRFDAVADVLGDQLYESIQPLPVPAEVVTAMGRTPDGTEHFDLRFAEDAASAAAGSRSLTDGQCEAGYFSWSKGCSSWPW